MKKTLEFPKKGVKSYSPEEGWTESPPQDKIENLSENNNGRSSQSKNQINIVSDEKNSSLDNSNHSGKPNNMVAVGDALEQLFDTLNSSSTISSAEAKPTWKDVAELSRKLEEKLDSRKEILDKLSVLDEELNLTRKELLTTLKKLGKFENEQLSAATVRASVSAMAIEVLAKKLT